jgi:Na+/proline symporter
MGVIGGTVHVLSSHGAEQLIVQRVLACKTVADGRKALILSAVLIFPLFFVFLLVGTMLWVFYQSHPMKIPIPAHTDMKQNDFIYPIFMLSEVPAVLRGFLLVAILSAAMSSVSSALTSLASVSTMDFAKKFFGERSEEFYLRFSKHSTVFWSVALVGVALLSGGVRSVFDTAFSLRGLTSGALLGGVLVAVFARAGTSRPVVVGMFAALLVMTGIEVFPKWALTKPWWTRVVGTDIFWPWYTLLGVTVMLLVTFGWRALMEEKARS